MLGNKGYTIDLFKGYHFREVKYYLKQSLSFIRKAMAFKNLSRRPLIVILEVFA